METTKPKRRRKSKPKVENYYKILGVRSNSRPEKIKQSYVQLVKQYPPEQHPEEFQRIRRAYETLRDPLKREEYDLIRKFGGSLDHVLEEAVEYMEQENWDKAEELFLKILNTAPRAVGARIGLAQIQIFKNDLDEFDKQTQLLFEAAESEENQIKALILKAKMLIDMEYPERALVVLDLLTSQYSGYADLYRVLLIQAYQALGRGEEALKMIEAEIPALEAQEPDHIFLFIGWINGMMELEKWQLSDKIKKRVRQFLKSINDEDDKLMVISSLIDEYENYFAGGLFREAEYYMELLYYIDPKHPVVVEGRREVQELSRIKKEIDRMVKDNDLFPLVTMHSMEWFFAEFSDLNVASEYLGMIPPAILQEMELMDEEFAAGIKRLKKKYPIIYRRYQDSWDELFEEKTSGLNRDARRRLR